MLEIFDSTGRRLHASELDSTPDRIDWPGTDSGGRRVANGVYWAVLREGDRHSTAKVVILR